MGPREAGRIVELMKRADRCWSGRKKGDKWNGSRSVWCVVSLVDLKRKNPVEGGKAISSWTANFYDIYTL